jgi:serine protease Do
VIGINTAIVATGQGIGFAIPISMAKEIKDRLIAQGKVVRGWLGVGIQELTEELARQFGVNPEDGVLVGNVIKDSPAERGGMKPGDIIQEFNGRKIGGVHQLQREVAQSSVGSPARLKVLREKQPMRLTIVLGEQPTDVVAAEPGSTPAEAAERFGLTVQDLTSELRNQLRLNTVDGVMVSSVDEAGPAARASIRPGDVITEANREPVKSTRDFSRILGQMRRGQNLLLLVRRDGNSRFVVLPPKN